MNRDYRSIPGATLRAIINYVVDGLDGGDFITGVLENNLSKAFNHGDLSNLRALWATVTFCVNRIPAECWGTKMVVQRWGGFRGSTTIPKEELEAYIAEWYALAIKDTVLDPSVG